VSGPVFLKLPSFITTWFGPSLLDCFKSWNMTNDHISRLPPFICWFVWLERNNTIFQTRLPPSLWWFTDLLDLLLAGLPFIGEHIYLSSLKMINLSERLPTAWFDGAAQSDGLNCGAGGHLRLSNSSYYCWTLNCGSGSNTKAELLGAWASLLLASRLTFFGPSTSRGLKNYYRLVKLQR
jgi:hypothetical protein